MKTSIVDIIKEVGRNYSNNEAIALKAENAKLRSPFNWQMINMQELQYICMNQTQLATSTKSRLVF